MDGSRHKEFRRTGLRQERDAGVSIASSIVDANISLPYRAATFDCKPRGPTQIVHTVIEPNAVTGRRRRYFRNDGAG
jgi:hypothetical protein